MIESGGKWASVSTPVIRLSFQAVEGYLPPAWPGQGGQQQMHLDVLVEGLQTATAQVQRLGARALTDVLEPGFKEWRNCADPAGHPFCLVTVPE